MNENITIFEASMFMPGDPSRCRTELFFTKQDAKEYLEGLFAQDDKYQMGGWVGVIEVSNDSIDFQPEYVFAKGYMVTPRTDWQKEGF